MAIIKNVLIDNFGITAQYNKIVKAEIDARAKVVEVMVAVYVSAETRDSGAQPIWHEYVRIPFSAFSQDPRNLLYPLLGMYTGSYLKNGVADSETTAGNYTITLTDEAQGLTVEPSASEAEVMPPDPGAILTAPETMQGIL
jgi:hypothetical protein